MPIDYGLFQKAYERDQGFKATPLHSNYFRAKNSSCEAVKMEANGRGSSVEETVISCLEVTRLRGISTCQFIEFKRLRELYEKQVAKKSKQLKEYLIPTSYRASIEDDGLRIFVAARRVEWPSIDELTQRLVQQCIDNRCKRKDRGEQLYLVDQAARYGYSHADAYLRGSREYMITQKRVFQLTTGRWIWRY